MVLKTLKMPIHGRYVFLCWNLSLKRNCAPPGGVRTVRTLRGSAHHAHPLGGVRTISKSMHLERIWLKIWCEYGILVCKTIHNIQHSEPFRMEIESVFQYDIISSHWVRKLKKKVSKDHYLIYFPYCSLWWILQNIWLCNNPHLNLVLICNILLVFKGSIEGWSYIFINQISGTQL